MKILTNHTLRHVLNSFLFYFFFLVLAGSSFSALSSLEQSIYLESGYRYRAGDHSSDQDVAQYQNIELQNNARSFLFYWYGGFRKDIDGAQSIIDNSVDRSDAAFHEAGDSVNRERMAEYRVYEGYARYNSRLFSVTLGRRYLYGFEFLHLDGLHAGVSPLPWINVELLGGIPVDYDYTSYYTEGELAAGVKTGVSLFDNRWINEIYYLKLKQETYRIVSYANSAPAEQYISNDNFISYRTGLYFTPLANAELSASVLNGSPHLFNGRVSGSSHNISYYGAYESRPETVEDASSRLTVFSAVMPATEAYRRIEAGVDQLFFPSWLPGLQQMAIETSVTGQTFTESMATTNQMFNADYKSALAGISAFFNGNLDLRLFVEVFRGGSFQNDSEYFGGEVSKKWKRASIRAGSAFYAYRHESDYENQITKDTFNARNYYARGTWTPFSYLEMKAGFAYEQAELVSLSEYTVDSSAGGKLYSGVRNYYKVDLRAVNRF